MNEFSVTTKIHGVMIIRLGKVEFLQFSISVSSVYMDSRVCWHECYCFIQNRHCLMVPLLLEKACSHIVVCQTNLNGHIILKSLRKHELAGSF